MLCGMQTLCRALMLITLCGSAIYCTWTRIQNAATSLMLYRCSHARSLDRWIANRLGSNK